ncbi:MAG: hypothetical protein K2X81_25975, partial [Candidatus Obscuribacterales bacterium]|nr:hypothetical protein [Candidatus Obscuribacterales bacterium]
MKNRNAWRKILAWGSCPLIFIPTFCTTSSFAQALQTQSAPTHGLHSQLSATGAPLQLAHPVQGSQVHSAAPTNFDLSSTASTVRTPHHIVPIMVGGNLFTATPGSMITIAERMAMFQVMKTGTQSLQIGASGNAVGGNFSISSGLASHISSLTIPSGVTAVTNAAVGSLNISGNLSNFGTLLAVSTNPSLNSATISANNILNSGVLSTLPQSAILGLSSAVSQLNLNLIAQQNIVNSGQISSSGSLSLVAGNSISNLPSASISAVMAPSIQSVGALSIYAGSGIINNAGLISSINSNVSITAAAASNIAINNANGTIQALNGAINVRDASYAGNANLSILGGNLAAKSFNLNTGCGIAQLAVEHADGVLNMTAGQTAVSASTKDLVLGDIKISADPAFYNT